MRRTRRARRGLRDWRRSRRADAHGAHPRERNRADAGSRASDVEAPRPRRASAPAARRAPLPEPPRRPPRRPPPAARHPILFLRGTGRPRRSSSRVAARAGRRRTPAEDRGRPRRALRPQHAPKGTTFVSDSSSCSCRSATPSRDEHRRCPSRASSASATRAPPSIPRRHSQVDAVPRRLVAASPARARNERPRSNEIGVIGLGRVARVSALPRAPLREQPRSRATSRSWGAGPHGQRRQRHLRMSRSGRLAELDTIVREARTSVSSTAASPVAALRFKSTELGLRRHANAHPRRRQGHADRPRLTYRSKP